MVEDDELHGLVAVFDDPDALLKAAHQAKDAGYKRMDAYSPIPIHHLGDAIGFKDNRLPYMVLAGGIIGLCLGLYMQYYTTGVGYPMNIGGRPYFSWPSFIPITFECTVLFAGLTAVFGMLGLNGLPKPYHPIFNLSDFQLASRNKFFLCIEATDPKFERAATQSFLQSLNPIKVEEVER